MLQLFLTPTSIVFNGLDDDLFVELQEKYNIDFEVVCDEIRVQEKPEHLYKLLYRLTCDYDIELN